MFENRRKSGLSEIRLKDQNHFPPEHRRHLSDLLKIIIICTRNTRSNVPKSILNCFRNTQDMFCCKNKIKTHDSVPNFIGETRKIRDFDRFSLSELGFGMTIWKDPRQQSTKVKTSKILCLSFTKNQNVGDCNFFAIGSILKIVDVF